MLSLSVSFFMKLSKQKKEKKKMQIFLPLKLFFGFKNKDSIKK